MKSITLIRGYVLFNLLLTIVVGCSTIQKPEPIKFQVQKISSNLDNQTRQMVEYIVSAPDRDNFSFSDTLFGTSASVTVGQFYTSALGSNCRRAIVKTLEGEELIAVCLNADTWEIVPRIYPSKSETMSNE